jgi:hypothetical protein
MVRTHPAICLSQVLQSLRAVASARAVPACWVIDAMIL